MRVFEYKWYRKDADWEYGIILIAANNWEQANSFLKGYTIYHKNWVAERERVGLTFSGSQPEVVLEWSYLT